MRAFLGMLPLVAVLTVQVAAADPNKLPSPANSVCPGCGGVGSPPAFVRVVEMGSAGGVPHRGSEVTVLARDFVGNPVAGATIWLDFSECPDVVLCDAVPAGYTQHTECAFKSILATTDATGQAKLIALGSGLADGMSGAPGPGSVPRCVKIIADGLILSTASAVIYDLDGATRADANGTAVSDLAELAIDLFSGNYQPRSDFSSIPNPAFPADADGCSGPAPDCGALTVLDVTAFASGVLFAPAPNSALGCPSAAGIASYCPH